MEQSMNRYIGQMLDDRYEILEVIGSGGMSVVYKAMCHKLHRYVAVKILRDEMAEDAELKNRFQAEAHAVAMLSQSNIVSVYDVGHSGDTEYIVMELIEGVTLKEYLQQKGRLSWQESIFFAEQISSALVHAHSRGIIHQDIKPQNVMLLQDGTIKVMDFGIARAKNSVNDKTSAVLGTAHYISPDDKQAIMFLNAEAMFSMMDTLMTGTRILIWMVGLGTLFAGAIGVSNIMMVTVKERTTEIGIRRAIGARPKDILQQILSESMVLTTVAGMAGISFAVLILQILESAANDPGVIKTHYQVSFGLAIGTCALLIALGMLAGLAPAYRAMAIKPIEAIRDE